MIKSFLEALPAASSSPFAFLAYLFVVVVFAYVTVAQYRLKRIASIIKDVPEADRAKLLAKEYNTLPAHGLSAEQWIKSRRQMLWFWSFAAVLGAFLVLAVVALQKVP